MDRLGWCLTRLTVTPTCRITMHLISQAKAAEITGLSRAEFLAALARFGISPFQYDADEIIQEVSGE
jgi:predicted HTH domain antitoxin